jgi:hypothetical protein
MASVAFSCFWADGASAFHSIPRCRYFHFLIHLLAVAVSSRLSFSCAYNLSFLVASYSRLISLFPTDHFSDKRNKPRNQASHRPFLETFGTHSDEYHIFGPRLRNKRTNLYPGSHPVRLIPVFGYTIACIASFILHASCISYTHPMARYLRAAAIAALASSIFADSPTCGPGSPCPASAPCCSGT